MKIALTKCDFRIFLLSQLFAMNTAAPKGRLRGGSITWSILENMELPRRAPEGP